jgi:hypothetical protein
LSDESSSCGNIVCRIIFSATFRRIGDEAIGLNLIGRVFVSPFGMGVILTVFHDVGSNPLAKDMLRISATIGAMDSLHSLATIGCRPSGPAEEFARS